MSQQKSRYELFLEEEARKAQPTKRCPKCKEIKALGEFHKNRNNPLGVVAYCKVCVLTPRRKYKNLIDRFWKVYHENTHKVGDCVEWIGQYSHGKPVYSRKSVRRRVYNLSYGDLPDDMLVTNTCNNIRCVRHSHLKKVTQNEMNVILANHLHQDGKHWTHIKPERLNPVRGEHHWARQCPDRFREKVTEARERSDTARGARHGGAKLTEAEVRLLRRMYETGDFSQHELSRRFGVSVRQIGRIIRGEKWAHVQ